MAKPQYYIVISSDDEEEEESVVAPAVSGAEPEQPPLFGISDEEDFGISDEEDAEEDEPPPPPPSEEGSDDEEGSRRLPDWLPDGFGMEAGVLEDGTLVTTYICPVGFRFSTKKGVLDYCFSHTLERAIQANATLDDTTTLQGKYRWLLEFPGHDWVVEIRAGGENMTKMFKFYANLSNKVRLVNKEDVLRYKPKDQNYGGANNEECDTSCEDNILAQLQFKVYGLPPGWVKETVFRKYKDGSIRKDTFFTDPVNGRVYLSLKSALQYFSTGIDSDSLRPYKSITDMYYFDKCTDMIPYLATRLKIGGTEDQNEEAWQTSHLDLAKITEEEEFGHKVPCGDKEEEEEEDEEVLENKRRIKRYRSISEVYQV
ncbi:hypothetical protein ACP4OV_004317 [Aristida adscensionis]